MDRPKAAIVAGCASVALHLTAALAPLSEPGSNTTVEPDVAYVEIETAAAVPPQVPSAGGGKVTPDQADRGKRAVSSQRLAAVGPRPATTIKRVVSRSKTPRRAVETETQTSADDPGPRQPTKAKTVGPGNEAPLILTAPPEVLLAEELDGPAPSHVDKLLKQGLSERLNDPPAYPQLALDEEGNLSWYFYHLVATIHPDGEVRFSRGKKRGAEPTGGYCKELTLPGGACQPLPTVPPLKGAFGPFPENPIKRWFLAKTQKLRDDLSHAAHHKALAGAAAAADRNIHAIWSDRSVSIKTKRLYLFQLWDECEEPLTKNDTRPAARAGQRARERIVGFVTSKLPAGSAHAYSAQEIHRLNKGRSSLQRFAPY